MPQSVFDLGGELTVDTTQLKSISEQVGDELGKVARSARPRCRWTTPRPSPRSSHEARRGRSGERDREEAHHHRRHRAGQEAKSLAKLWPTNHRPTKGQDSLEHAGRYQVGRGRRQYLSGNTGMAIGGMMLSGGLGAVALGAAIKSAYAVDLMEKSTEQVFGAAADSYKAEAEKMADATGFMTTADPGRADRHE